MSADLAGLRARNQLRERCAGNLRMGMHRFAHASPSACVSDDKTFDRIHIRVHHLFALRLRFEIA